MLRPLSYTSLGLAATLLLTACQDDEPAQEEASPSPIPASELETTSLPESPADLADLVGDRMREALSVEVGITVEPEEPEEEADDAPIEDVSMTMLLTDPPSAQMTVVDHDEDRPSTAHIVVEEETMYVKLEEEPILEEKDWMRISQKEIDSAEDDIGPFAEIFQVMLTETNSSLDQASGDSSLDVVELGELDDGPETEETDDGEITRYTGTTSTHDLVDAGNEDFEQAVDAGLDEVGWEIAVTEKGLPSEYTVQLVTPGGEEAESTVHYSNWGAEVEISRPPKDNTGTLKESLGY